MSIKPISFKSFLVFTMPGQPTVPVPELIKTSFANNRDLYGYKLKEDMYVHQEERDGTIFNATKDMGNLLDFKYRTIEPLKPKQVVLSEVTFTTSPTTTTKKYFLTASSPKEERRLLDILNRGSVLVAGKPK